MKEESSQLEVWMGSAAPEEKGTDTDEPVVAAAQWDRKFTEMPSGIFCNILVNTAL